MIDLAVPTDTLALFNLRQYFKKNSKESFKYIFFDNFEYIHNLYLSGKLRDITFDNIQKTILCSSVYLGFDLFECPNCGHETIVPHTCSSRFCSKCSSNISNKAN